MRQEALDWFNEGEVDLRRAHMSLEAEDYSWACFAAHQAIEKAMKALIIGLGRRTPPRIHDLTELFREMADLGLEIPRVDLSEVSQYYVTARYPNAGLHRPSLSFTQTQAERAIQIAEEMFANARQLLAP